MVAAALVLAEARDTRRRIPSYPETESTAYDSSAVYAAEPQTYSVPVYRKSSYEAAPSVYEAKPENPESYKKENKADTYSNSYKKEAKKETYAEKYPTTESYKTEEKTESYTQKPTVYDAEPSYSSYDKEESYDVSINLRYLHVLIFSPFFQYCIFYVAEASPVENVLRC